MSEGSSSNKNIKKGSGALVIAGTIGLHLVSGILVGGAIGYGLDRWLEISPWGMAVGVIIGIMAGFRNIYVDARRLLEIDQSDTKNAPDDLEKD